MLFEPKGLIEVVNRSFLTIAALFSGLFWMQPVQAIQEVGENSALSTQPTREQLDFFEKRIRPVLVKHCYKCHSEEAAKKDELRGGLLLDSRDGILAGGESGEALVPGTALAPAVKASNSSLRSLYMD